VFTHLILVSVRLTWNLNRGGTTKSTRYYYTVLSTVLTFGKSPKSELYHAVEKHQNKTEENYYILVLKNG